MEVILFPNDNNQWVLSPRVHKTTIILGSRPYHEILFRKIHQWLFKNNFLNGNIIDLGSWIGDNTLPWSKMTQNTIYAIDPSTNNIEYINLLAKINNCTNIKTIKTAISDKDEIVSTNGHIDHCSFYYDNNFNKKTREGIHKIRSSSLDNLYKNKELDNIKYIHLDVEGMEYIVLKGSTNIIQKYRPIITYEVHLDVDIHMHDIEIMLQDNKYNIFMINEILPGNREDCRNFLAIPCEYISNYLDKVNFINKDISNDKAFVECIYNDFMSFKYILISHVDNRYVYTTYEKLDDSEYAFNFMNGGKYATVLLELVYSDNIKTLNVIKKYGDNNVINQIIVKANYLVNNNIYPKNIIIPLSELSS
uniref:Methyltransferase n=1 Tax=Pithovirus LCPAC101 TaxID=2506586 RepID=A0A481Z486_9VIRU|nr:MAG: methyltransferase [Pithovirus LCPAC101]